MLKGHSVGVIDRRRSTNIISSSHILSFCHYFRYKGRIIYNTRYQETAARGSGGAAERAGSATDSPSTSGGGAAAAGSGGRRGSARFAPSTSGSNSAAGAAASAAAAASGSTGSASSRPVTTRRSASNATAAATNCGECLFIFGPVAKHTGYYRVTIVVGDWVFVDYTLVVPLYA